MTVLDSGFMAVPQLSCRFGDAPPLPATWLASFAVICTTPPQNPGFAAVAVSLNLKGWSTTPVAVQALQAQAAMAVEPAFASSSGGTTVKLTGSSFANASRLQVQLHQRGRCPPTSSSCLPPSTTPAPSPSWRRTAATTAGMEVWLVADGADFTDRAAQLTYLPMFEAVPLTPSTGSRRGGTAVEVTPRSTARPPHCRPPPSNSQ